MDDITIELESLREEIAQLQSLFLHPAHLPQQDESPDVIERIPSAGLFEDGPLGMVLIDREGRITKSNRAFCRMIGFMTEELCSLRFQNFVLEPESFSRIIGQLFDGVYPIAKTEVMVRNKIGGTFWVQISASRIPEGQRSCLIIIEDISDRKVMEQTLHAEKRLLERLINSSVDGIVAFDRDGFFTVWNSGMERIFGISARETLGRPVFLACPFLKALGEDVNFTAALNGKRVVSTDKCYTIPGAAESVYFEGYYGPIYNPGDNSVAGGLAIIRDVSDRKLAEEARRVSEARYRELFENAYDMAYTYDMAGKMTSINKTAERILGYSSEDALQMNFIQLIAPESRQLVQEMMEQQFATEAPFVRELEIVTKGNDRIVMEINNRVVFREGKPFRIQGIARDVSERKKVEAELKNANKRLETWARELEQRTWEMKLLNELGDQLHACLTIEETYEVIVRVAREVFPVQGGALFVLDTAHNIVESVAEWGDTSNMESVFTPDECWALRRGKIHWEENAQTGLLCKHLQSRPKGYLCVPLIAQSLTMGVLYLAYAEDSQMSESKRRLASSMAERIALALSNLRLLATSRRQPNRDQLTGLFNHDFMEESLKIELYRATRTPQPVSVIMFTLDNFHLLKEDCYSPDTADSVLCRTGMLLQAHIRKGDIACRFSGHAFIVILPRTSLEVSRPRADIFRNMLRTLEVKDKTGKDRHMSASVGLAMFPDHGQTVETLLRSAETAVRRARNRGGDCVIVAY